MQQLQLKDEELREVQQRLEETKSHEAETKAKVEHLEQTRDQLLAEAQEWNTRVLELHEQVETFRKEQTLAEITVTEKQREIEALNVTINNLSLFQNAGEEVQEEVREKLSELLDVAKVKAELKRALDLLQSRELELCDKNKEFSQMQVRQVELEESHRKAQEQKTEAETKLEVLSAYFRDKETHLQKELGTQVAIRQQKEDFVSSAEQKVAGIIQENKSFKEQLSSMKNELQETERSLKAQVLAQEKKAHENWLAARAAERKLEEAKNESAALRQRLTLLERDREAVSKPFQKKQDDTNGELTSSDLDDPDSSSSLPPSQNVSTAERIPPPPFPPFFLPMDRPLPPPPFPMFPPPPRFMPPPSFSPEPWHYRNMPPMHLPDRRISPLDFERRSLNTPVASGRLSPPSHPRGRTPPPMRGRPMSPPPGQGRMSPPMRGRPMSPPPGQRQTPPPMRGRPMSPPLGQDRTPPPMRGRPMSPPPGQRRTPPPMRGRPMSPPPGHGRMSHPPPGRGRTSSPGRGGEEPVPLGRNGYRHSSPPRHYDFERRPERFSPGRDYAHRDSRSETPPHLPRFHDGPPMPAPLMPLQRREMSTSQTYSTDRKKESNSSPKSARPPSPRNPPAPV